MRLSETATTMLLVCVFAVGCGDDDADTAYPYNSDETTVIGGGEPTTITTPNGADCVEVGNGACVSPQEQCGDEGTADVILDENGNVVDTICYPTSGAPIENIPAEAVPVQKTQNNAVVVLDAVDDGADIQGDLSVDANNVVLYGENPDVSIIGGDLDVTKNNTTLRGIRISGDVHVEFNNANFVFCVIEGDLTIDGNNTTVAGCDVWGNVHVNGENTILVSNRLADPGPFAAQGLICNDNVTFSDDNEDGNISESELGSEIDCEDKAQ